MAEIVAIGKLSAEKKKELAEAGVEVREHIDIDRLKLPEPQHGETFCVYAEPDEVNIYVEMHEIANKVDRWMRQIMGEAMRAAGKSIEDSDLNRPWHEALTQDGLKPIFGGVEKEEEFFRLFQRKQYLHTLLYWKMGERTGLHSYRLGLRKPAPGEDRLRVVRIQKRLDMSYDDL